LIDFHRHSRTFDFTSALDVKSRVVFLCHSSTGHPLLMSWYLRAESPRPLVSLGVPTVLPGLDEVLYREAEERKQRQELREQEALHLDPRWVWVRGADILIPKTRSLTASFAPEK